MKRLIENKDGKCPCGCNTDDECTCKTDCKKCDCHKTNESTNFDKFIDSILISENKRTHMKCEPDSPQRLRAKRNQENPLGRIRFGRNS